MTHLNKDSSGKKAVYRAMGSLAFTAAARTVHLVTKHPESPSKRVVSVVKNNLSEEKGARVYTIEDGRVVWSDEVVHFTSDELEGGAAKDQGPSALDEAKGFLMSHLSKGPDRVGSVRSLADSEGISRSSLQRAKSALNVHATQDENGTWYWSLDGPDAPDPAAAPDEDEPDDRDDLLALARAHGYRDNGYV